MIEPLIINNDFEYSGNPIVLVFRNTNVTNGLFIVDDGENAPDGFILCDAGLKDFIRMQGRTKPNKSYLDKFFSDGKLDDNERFNYIASSYVKNGFIKGWHYGRPALVQRVKAPLIRSSDKIIGNKDDYFEYGKVGDNFHGWLKSLGCWSVRGSMGVKDKDDWNKEQLTNDWKIAHNWIYETNNTECFFDRLCFEREDWETPCIPRLRFGSKGGRVKKLQNRLGTKVDGDFGFKTLQKVLELQENEGRNKTGVI